MSEKGRAADFATSGQFGGRFGNRRGMPGVKPKSLKKTLSRLWEYFGTERNYLLLILFLVIISAAIGLIIPYVIGRVIDTMNVTTEINKHVLTILITVLAISYVTNSLLQFSQGFLMSGISQRIVLRLRKALFGKLHSLPISFFDTKTHGEIMSRLSNDIDNISVTISASTTQLMSLVITITGSITMMFILSPILGVVAMISLPLMTFLTKVVTKKTRVLYREQQKVLGQLNGHIEEHISGLYVIHAFNQENKSIEEFSELNTKYRNIGRKADIYSGLIMPVMNVINNFTFALLAGIGGILAYHDMITVGIIASFLTYSRQFGRPLVEVANIYNTLQTAVAGTERVFDILDEKNEKEDEDTSIVLDKSLLKGNIEFNHVYFSYTEEVEILHDIHFKVKQGTRIALVGETGAGKTTIVNLLARFYDVTSGQILIDGMDIREYTRVSLRKSFGIVLQDTYLFSGTIKENIRYGKLDATDEEIYEAAEKASADIFINRLPHGYDTELSESGNSLSEGQRQLIAISRAILADAPILILDEATSSVDTRTEKHIQDAMLRLMQGRTSFIIAHRLSTIRDCDIIMVVNEGRIVETGNHQSLLELNGVYANMYYSQMKNIIF